MSSRRNVLKILGTGLFSATGAAIILQSCAGRASYRTRIQNRRIIIPKIDAVSLQKENGILMVEAPALPGPLILRNTAGTLVALSSICTHRGCEVRPLPTSLQCPCHGSEYDEFGDVLEGPATAPLQKYPVIETKDSIIIEVHK